MDIGAYGNTPEATPGSPDVDADGLPDAWEMEFFGVLSEDAAGDADGDTISNIAEYRSGQNPASPRKRWYVDGAVLASGNGRSWETAFKTIQEGIDAAGETDQVIVAQGTYAENLVFRGKNIILRSTDPFAGGG